MAVKIGDKVYRNEQEQVRKNMEDIEFLKGKIKDVFKTTATLTSSSVSVALVDTNVTDEEEGWLMSEDGLLFAITGNDGTNLLISYYADLKGPQGDTGSTGPTGPAGYSIRYSSDDFVPGTTSYTKSNVHPSGQLKSNDWVVFANGYMAVISTVGDSTINIWEDSEVLLDISGGSTLYQHNIRLYASINTSRVLLTIINDSNTAFTLDSLKTYLQNNFKNTTTTYLDNKYILANGMTSEGTYANKMVIGLCYYTVAANIAALYENGAVVGLPFTDIQDTVIAL